MPTDRIMIAQSAIQNDWYLNDNNELAVVTDAEAVGQHARARLLSFVNEWFLDTEAGVPWLEEILGRSFDRVLAEAIIKETILDTDGVTSLREFLVSFDRRLRRVRTDSVRAFTEYEKTVSI